MRVRTFSLTLIGVARCAGVDWGTTHADRRSLSFPLVFDVEGRDTRREVWEMFEL